MADDMNKNPLAGDNEDTDELEDVEVYTLTDEDGNEKDFELIGKCTLDDATYYALTELDDDGNQVSDEYVILRLEDEDGEEILVSVDDDDEFDRVADFFDDQFSDIDYDV
ncbi:MAG: DUF1292 domain-containing protein [Eubacteriales bacterium]